jgi:hypothetical protein
MDGKVRFEGMGPFQLPVAQEASATGHLDKGVTVTFLLNTGGGQDLSAVNVRINADAEALHPPAESNRRVPRHKRARRSVVLLASVVYKSQSHMSASVSSI